MKGRALACIREINKAFEKISSVPVILLVVLCLVVQAYAQDNWTVDGANGSLYVSGALTESACRLDMPSSHQDIQLENAGTGSLQKTGAQGKPLHFYLRLKDCVNDSATMIDERTGSVLWSPDQPAVRVSFLAKADKSNATLISVQGVSGIALRMKDGAGRDIRLGSQGEAIHLSPGQNELAYSVMTERTASRLTPGKFYSVINLHLSYE